MRFRSLPVSPRPPIPMAANLKAPTTGQRSASTASPGSQECHTTSTAFTRCLTAIDWTPMVGHRWHPRAIIITSDRHTATGDPCPLSAIQSPRTIITITNNITTSSNSMVTPDIPGGLSLNLVLGGCLWRCGGFRHCLHILPIVMANLR